MKTFIATPSKHAALFAAIFLLLSTPAFAQFTITGLEFSNAFSQLGSSVSYNDTGSAGLQPIINQTGANQTWNFQGLPFVLDTSSSNNSAVAYPGGAAEADSFSNATNVLISLSGGTTYYGFYRIDQTGFYILGSSQISGGIPSVTIKYTPPLEEFAFPLTYQTTWSSTSRASVSGLSITQEIDGLVDGSGYFTLPGNITTQALRVKTKTTTSSSVYSDTSYSFNWVTITAYSADISADAAQQASSASYSVPGSANIVLENNSTAPYSLSVGSNPVSSPTNVSFTMPSESRVRISLMDPLGRESLILMNGMAHTGVNTLSLDPATLLNGTYFLRIESDGNSAMQKMIVAH